VNVNEFIKSGSGFLSKEDLGKSRPKVMVSGIDVTEFDGDKKLVLKFQGKEKGLTLNKTNTQILAHAWGEETDGWLGQMVELWVDPYVTFGGKVVGGIKVTPTPAVKPLPPPPQTPVMAQPQAAPFDDDIPF
jgi:hypothetical protein